MMMSNKRKSFYLLTGMLVSSLIIYQLVIKKTILYRNYYFELRKKEALAQNFASRLRLLKREEMKYDSIISLFSYDNNSIQNRLFGSINETARLFNLELEKFSAPHIYVMDNIYKQTYFFSVKGDFKNILELVYFLEQKQNFGEILHVSIYKKSTYRTNSDTGVLAEIGIQILTVK